MSDRWIRRHTPDYVQAFNNLLPTGMAWPRTTGTVLQKVVSGLASIWGVEVETFADTLLNIESDPRQTAVLLLDWERAWGLPDKCLAEPQTVEARRVALVHKMTLLGAQSREFFIGIAAEIGYTITIREFAPFMAGISRCGDTSDLDGYVTDPPLCQLLLHFSGQDGSKTILDDSGYCGQVTNVNNVQIDTSVSAFGGSSGLFDGTSYLALGHPARATASVCSIAIDALGNAILTVGGTVTGIWYPGYTVAGVGVYDGTTIVSQLDGVPGGAGTYRVTPSQTVASVAMTVGTASPDYALHLNKFTIDFQMRLAVTGTEMILYDTGATDGFFIHKKADDKIYFSTGASDLISGTTVLTTGQFYHISLTRDLTGFRLFVNGVMQGGYAGTEVMMSSIGGPYIGGRPGTTNLFAGWLDEFRILKDNATWVADFVPPVTAYDSHDSPIGLHYRWEIGPPEMRFYWVIHVESLRYLWFRASSGQAGIDPHLRIGLATDLECMLRRWKPAQTEIIFDYSPLVTLNLSQPFDTVYMMLDLP